MWKPSLRILERSVATVVKLAEEEAQNIRESARKIAATWKAAAEEEAGKLMEETREKAEKIMEDARRGAAGLPPAGPQEPGKEGLQNAEEGSGSSETGRGEVAEDSSGVGRGEDAKGSSENGRGEAELGKNQDRAMDEAGAAGEEKLSTEIDSLRRRAEAAEAEKKLMEEQLLHAREELAHMGVEVEGQGAYDVSVAIRRAVETKSALAAAESAGLYEELQREARRALEEMAQERAEIVASGLELDRARADAHLAALRQFATCVTSHVEGVRKRARVNSPERSS